MDEAKILRRIALFGELSAAERDELLVSMRLRRVARGETLVEQGSASDALFIVAFGLFEVRVSESEEPVAEISADQPIGEIGFFAGGPRTASVVAARDSAVLELDREAFDGLAMRQPKIYRAILRAMARRLGEMTERRRNPRRFSQVRTLAVIGGGADNAIPPRFIDRWRAVCMARPGTRVLSASDLDGQLGGSHKDEFSIAAWLTESETACDLVVCIADAALTEWTKCVLGNANQLLIVVEGASAATLNPVETFAFGLFPPSRRKLVCLHERRTGVCAPASGWLSDREVAMVHHLALEDDKDLYRLRRFLTGDAVGFVAGGGGAHGPAHIGIYKALCERGFVFDIFGGASVGAGMVAGFAQLEPPEAVDAGVHELFIRRRAFRRMTFPRYSLIDHVTFDRALQYLYRQTSIEDLWLPYFAVATDLSEQTLRVIRRGPLWRAVRASCSIPGVLPPIFSEDGHMLVDGSIAQNLPLDAIKSLKTGPNVIVDLDLPVSRPAASYDSLPGRRELLAKLLNPFARKTLPAFPGPAAVVQQSIFANVRHGPLPLGPSDLLLHPPPFPGSSYMNWSRHAEVVDAAYDWALSAIDRLKGENHPAIAAMEAAISGKAA
ncbi:MAG: patatin-like phospholipase family protein [Methylobacteriaceae bacterium]|nr:patatin-like phospholipase family protein [Methylobacteriaceae bacterium]